MHKETGETVKVGSVEAMSKSKRNTVDPGAIIDRFGADTARWFILSDNPPERDMEWTEAGVAGAHRFLRRVWSLVTVALPALPPRGSVAPEPMSNRARALRRATHRTIAAVTQALETFAMNVAVARLHELANAIAEATEEDGDGSLAWVRREALEALVRLASPMIPHLAEECWSLLAPGEPMLATLPWPEHDPALAAAETLTIAVQVMGKLRGTIEVPVGADEAAVFAAAEAEPNVARAIAGKTVRKRIHVPGRIVNFVL